MMQKIFRVRFSLAFLLLAILTFIPLLADDKSIAALPGDDEKERANECMAFPQNIFIDCVAGTQDCTPTSC